MRARWMHLCLLWFAIVGCEDASGPSSYGDINITTQVEAADGLDLKAVGELVKSVHDAEGLEKQLNKEGGLNNLDLNDDGKVDFVSVTEYGDSNTKGFSLTVEPEPKQIQEIATIEFAKRGEQADVLVSGNEQVYGPQHHYHYETPWASMLLMAYMFRPHPFYISPFHFGYYPGYYGIGYAPVSHLRYTTRTRAVTQRSTAAPVQRGNSGLSPNRGKVAASGIKRSLRSPTSSQRRFSRTVQRPKGASGFRSPVRTAPASRGAMPVRRRSFGGGFRGGFRSRR